jgi:uncharacterized protein YpuA (DUF1002 family)
MDKSKGGILIPEIKITVRKKLENILEDVLNNYNVELTDQEKIDMMALAQASLNTMQMYNQYEAGKLEVSRIKAEKE